MEKVKVSIIVPVYNVADYLERCLNSLKVQTLKEIEIICIDDGSTDGSGKILSQSAKSDHRISVVHQKNKGVSSARNLGISMAKGEYIAFVDSDDYVEENLCSDTYKTAVKYDADIVVFGGEVFSETEVNDEYLQGAYQFFRENLDVKKSFHVDDSVNALIQCNGSWPLIWNKLYKKELVLASGGFTEELALGEDEVFLFSVFPLAKRIIYIEEKYYHYLRNRPESATDRLVMDFEKKACSNLKMAKIVKQTWEKYEIMNEYEGEYLKRYVDLLFDNARSLDFSPMVQKEYTQQVFYFFNQFQLFSLDMLDEWYEKRYLKQKVTELQKEIDKKQKEIYGLINEKNIIGGQVQVLKEVAVQKDNVIGGQLQAIKESITNNGKNRQNEKRKKFKIKKKSTSSVVVKMKRKLTSSYLENIKNIYFQINQNGYAAYKRLKEAYGEDCIFLSCAFAGIGDAYLVGCYIEDWLEKNHVSNFRFLLGGKSEKKMVEAFFPKLRDRCTFITQKEHEWLRNLDRMCNHESDFYFFHHFDYMQPHLQITEKLQGYRDLTMKDLYLHTMGLAADAEYKPPVTEDLQDEAVEKLFEENHLRKKKTVLIAPYSTCLGMLSEEFWKPIVVSLKKKGYSVCCNCSSNEQPVTGTKGILIEFKHLAEFTRQAGYFIGFRSGLCDVISSCECKMAVIYPYASRQWGDGKALNYVGIKNMGLTDEIMEFELDKDNKNMKKVQESIIKSYT